MEVEVYEEARGRWAEFLNGKDVWSPLAHAGVLVEGMRDIVARAVAEQDAFEAGLEWTSGFGAAWIEARLEDQFRETSSADDAVDIGRLVGNTRLLGAATALALGANRASAEPTGEAWKQAVEVVRGLGIGVTDVNASAFGSGALELIEAAAPAVSVSPGVATVGSWATWLVTNGREGRGLRVPVVSVGGATPVKFMELHRLEVGGLLEHPKSALLPLGAKYVGTIRDAWESAVRPAVTWQLDGFKAGSGPQLGASHGGQVAVGMRLVTRGAEVYDSSHVVMALVEKTAEGGWLLKPLDGVVEVEKVGALLRDRPAGSIGVLAKRECHAAIEASVRERGRAGAVRTHWTSDLDEAATWAVGDLEELLDYLEEQIRMATQLPSYYPAGVSFEGIRQRVRVSTKRLSSTEEAAKMLEARRRGRAYLRRGAEQYEGQDGEGQVEVMDWSEAWSKERQVVVLGDPGFGKTWLLKAECCRLARKAIEDLTNGGKGSEEVEIPIYARLSNVNRTDQRFEDELIERASEARGEALRKRLEEGLKTGGCVVLLDAWDEVPVERVKLGDQPRFKKGRRQRLGQRLESFARENAEVRLVLTSRIVGFGASPIAGAKEMELVAFDREEVKAFTAGWFGPSSSKGAELARMVKTNHRVGQLGRIPLMLSIMCRVYGENANAKRGAQRQWFPVRRVELYSQCLAGLLRDWKEEDKKATVNDATVEALTEMLETVALELLEGGHEQFTVVTLREAIQSCQDGAECPRELRATKPGKLIDQFESDGILVRAGDERDSPLLFLHRTFQEYLSACALARRARNAGWEAIADEIGEKTLEVEWDEVVVLLAGRLDTPDLLLELLADERLDSVVRHRLSLAVECIGEVQEAKLHKELIDRIAADVIEMWGRHEARTSTSAVHPTTLMRQLAVSGGTKHIEQLLLSLMREMKHDHKKHVDEPLNTLIRDLGRAAATPAVLDALGTMLERDNVAVRLSAIRMLSFLYSAAATPRIIRDLTSVLRGSDQLVAAEAANVLLWMGSGAAIRRVRATLPHLMRADEPAVVVRAVEAYGGLGREAASPDMTSLLLTLLEYDDADVRATAAIALGNTTRSADKRQVSDALVRMVRDGSDYEVSLEAVRALDQLGLETPKVNGILLDVIRDGDLDSSYWAARHLSEACGSELDAECIYRLLTMLRSSDVNVRIRAAEAIGVLGPLAAREEIVTALRISLLDEDYQVIEVAFRSLRELGRLSDFPGVIDSLLEMLRWRNRRLRLLAGSVLATTDESSTPEVVAAMAEFLRTGDDDEREFASDTLSRMGSCAATPEVIDALLEMLRSGNEYYEYLAADGLRAMGAAAATPAVLKALHDLHRDGDQAARMFAMDVLSRIGSPARRIN